MKMRIIALVLMLFSSLQAQVVSDTFKVLSVREIPGKDVIPSNYLKLEISFVNAPPLTKGFFFFRNEKLLVKMKFTNVSDTTYFIPSVFYEYNPKFILHKDGSDISRKKVVHINAVVNSDFFYRVAPKHSYEVVVDVQKRHKFDLTKGHYSLRASLSSEFGKLVLHGKQYPIWSGTIESNSLSFSIDE